MPVYVTKYWNHTQVIKLDKQESWDNEFFKDMLDELVDFSEYDHTLAEGLRWIDSQAQKRGISFYQMCYIVLDKLNNHERTKEWLASKKMGF